MTSVAFLDPDLVFSVASKLAVLGWLALAVSPFRSRWSPVARFAAGRVLPLVFGVVYVVLFAATGMGEGGYDSLAAVQRLFSIPSLLAAGWLHYLAFDLFVGAWIAERAGLLGIPHLVVLPLLALTFLFGPAGLLAFAVVRAGWARRRPQAVLA